MTCFGSEIIFTVDVFNYPKNLFALNFLLVIHSLSATCRYALESECTRANKM